MGRHDSTTPVALLMVALAIALIVGLQGCAVLGLDGPDVEEREIEIADDVCSVWLPISYSSEKDTEQTVKEVRANNRAREEYCE